MLSCKQVFLIVILVCTVTSPVFSSAGEQQKLELNHPTAIELLDKYTEALDSTKSFIDHYEESSEYSYRFPVGPNQRFSGIASRGKSFKRGQYRYDDQRIYFQIYTWGDFNQELKDLPEDAPYYHCGIADSKDKKTYQHNRWIKGSNNDPGSAGRFPYERPDKVVLSRNGGVSYLVGYIDSDERLDAILRKASRILVRQATENVRGSECYVIDAHTKYGKYSVWLDPEHGYHPAKVMHWAKEGDRVHSHLLAKGDAGTAYLNNVRFEKVDGVWVPMEADAGFDRIVGGNPKHFNKEDIHYKRTKIILNPDHDKLGSFVDPIFEDPNNDPELVNGTCVRLDHNPTEYFWQDGKIVDEKGSVIADCRKKADKSQKKGNSDAKR